MSRLSHIILFTPEVERLRPFYMERLGLPSAREGHGWVALRPAGAELWLHTLDHRAQKEIAFALEVEALDAAVVALRAHGTEVTERENDTIFGRVAYFRDPEGNLVDLHAGTSVAEAGDGPSLPTLVLNCRNLPGTHSFYRDIVGLPVRVGSPWWVQFETGATSLALHPRTEVPERETHHGTPITLGFTDPGDVVAFVRRLESRGVRFSRQPTNEGYGTFAEAIDPDGNTLVFRGTVEPPAEALRMLMEAEAGTPATRTKTKASAAKKSAARSTSTTRAKKPAAKRAPARRRGS